MHPRVFAAIAVLVIVAALILVISASSDEQTTARATSPQEKTAVRLEGQLAKQPDDEKLLLRTAKAWVRAGAERLEAINPRIDPIPPAVKEDYEAGLGAWERYLRQTGGEASREASEMAGATYFQLVELGSTDPSKATANASGALRAEEIACKHEPILFTLSDLAIYHYFNGESAAGDKAAREAAASVSENDAIEPQEVIEQLDEYKERGEKFAARVKRGSETLEESGEDELDYVIKGYGAPAGLNGYEPGTGPES
jgi:hypothetical protein